jgi:hypothetical protein
MATNPKVPTMTDTSWKTGGHHDRNDGQNPERLLTSRRKMRPDSLQIQQSTQNAATPFLTSESLDAEVDADLEALAPEAFSIKDEQSANWLVRRIKECRRYAEHVSIWAAAEMRRAEREEEFFWFRFGAQLQTWAAVEIQKLKGRRKSLGLPAGTIGFRNEPAKLVVTDEGRLLDWCREHLPKAQKVTAEVSGTEAQQLLAWAHANCAGANCKVHVLKSVLNEHLKSTGEAPGGAEWMEAGEKFYVK